MMLQTHTSRRFEKWYHSHNVLSGTYKAGFPSWAENGLREQERKGE